MESEQTKERIIEQTIELIRASRGLAADLLVPRSAHF